MTCGPLYPCGMVGWLLTIVYHMSLDFTGLYCHHLAAAWSADKSGVELVAEQRK